MANSTWTDDTHYTDSRGNVWTAKQEGGAWSATSPAYTTSAQGAAGAAYQANLAATIEALASPVVAPHVQASWFRRYWLPVGIGSALAWGVSAPILAGAALGASARYVYEKFQATK